MNNGYKWMSPFTRASTQVLASGDTEPGFVDNPFTRENSEKLPACRDNPFTRENTEKEPAFIDNPFTRENSNGSLSLNGPTDNPFTRETSRCSLTTDNPFTRASTRTTFAPIDNPIVNEGDNTSVTDEDDVDSDEEDASSDETSEISRDNTMDLASGSERAFDHARRVRIVTKAMSDVNSLISSKGYNGALPFTPEDIKNLETADNPFTRENTWIGGNPFTRENTVDPGSPDNPFTRENTRNIRAVGNPFTRENTVTFTPDTVDPGSPDNPFTRENTKDIGAVGNPFTRENTHGSIASGDNPFITREHTCEALHIDGETHDALAIIAEKAMSFMATVVSQLKREGVTSAPSANSCIEALSEIEEEVRAWSRLNGVEEDTMQEFDNLRSPFLRQIEEGSRSGTPALDDEKRSYIMEEGTPATPETALHSFNSRDAKLDKSMTNETRSSVDSDTDSDDTDTDSEDSDTTNSPSVASMPRVNSSAHRCTEQAERCTDTWTMFLWMLLNIEGNNAQLHHAKDSSATLAKRPTDSAMPQRKSTLTSF
jgi:hypothetical protein